MLGRASIAFLLSGLALSPDLVPSPELTTAPWAAEMDAEVARLGARFPGKMAVYVSDPARGHRYAHRDDVPMYLASVVKTAFMIEVFRQEKAKALSFDETIEYTEERIRDGAPRVNTHAIGERLSVATLLEYMMKWSDNSASDMLAERVGLENIQRGLEEEGLPGFTRLTYLVDVRRGIFRNLDIAADDLRPIDVRTIRWTPIWEPQIAKLCEMLGKPPNTYDRQDMFDAYARYYETGVNEAPMRTMGLIYERMLRGELVSREASQKMIELMSDAHTSTNRLLGRLPPGTKVAHKTGSQFNRLCDTGIVFLPDLRPLVVAACMENGLVPPSEENVARLTRKAYDLAIAPRSANGTR